ncbi:hypothetical protein ACJJIU_10295 [Microbulbifer sp. CnH-101-E]|uniref:hypothetical protein n=1 Tax=unclassified Microbulbifer TaxID=2619833 RepID=UPI004039DD67
MANYTPLVIAFFGAGIGAFFAILKSKSEKLWAERFDTLKSTCEAANIIIHNHEALELHDTGVRTMNQQEMNELSDDFIKSKMKLRGTMANIKLLFNEKHSKEVEEAYNAMNDAIINARNAPPSEYLPDYLAEVSTKAKILLDTTTKLARKKIL